MVLDPFDLIAMSSGRSADAEATFQKASIFDFEGDEPAPSDEAAAPLQAEAPASGDLPAARPAEAMDEAMAEEFFVEIQNILNEASEEIFQLEKDPENIRRVNTIFRYFHSIKGNFIMTGFTNLGSFVHEVETVLDQMREKELKVDKEVIDLLLDTVKNLEQGIVEIRAGRGYEVRDPDLLAELARYKRAERADKPESDLPDDGQFHLSPLGTILYFSKLVTQGVSVYQSMFHIGPSFQEAGVVGYLIIKRLALIGDLIDTVPSLDKIEMGLGSDKIKVMFASTRSLQEVNSFCERQLKRFYNVVDYENLPVE
jgi:HPt (histidine-containing phosphotransfer) domain-containing protein